MIQTYALYDAHTAYRVPSNNDLLLTWHAWCKLMRSVGRSAHSCVRPPPIPPCKHAAVCELLISKSLADILPTGIKKECPIISLFILPTHQLHSRNRDIGGRPYRPILAAVTCHARLVDPKYLASAY